MIERASADEGSRSTWAPTHPFDAQWHVNVNQKTYGPYAGHDISRMVSNGQIKASDFVHANGGSHWVQAKDDPIIGALFENQSRKKAKNGRSPRSVLILVGASVIFAIFWAVWPYYDLYQLSVSLRDGDSIALEGQIEWSSVREGLRGDLNAMFLQSLRSEKPDAGIGLAAVLAPAIINQMIDSYVTPQNISYLIRNGKPAVPAAAVTSNEPLQAPAEQAPVQQSPAQHPPQFSPDKIAAALRNQQQPPAEQAPALQMPAQHPPQFSPDQTAAALRTQQQPDSGQREGPTEQFDISQITYAFFFGGPFTFKVDVLPSDARTKTPLVMLFSWMGNWKLTRIILPPDALDQKPPN